MPRDSDTPPKTPKEQREDFKKYRRNRAIFNSSLTHSNREKKDGFQFSQTKG